MGKKTNGGFLISQIKQIQGRVFERLLNEANVDEFNGAQGRILYILWQADSIPIISLSKQTGLAKTTLTSMLDRMEQAGLIVRIFDKTDRRQVKISLTDKARSLKPEYDDLANKMVGIFYKGFSDMEIDAFESNLVKIVNNLMEAESEK